MLTISELNNMPADTYRENLKDPAFLEAVNRLNNQAAQVAVPAPEVAPIAEEVAPITPEVAPSPVELRYEYQPTDEQGRPLGGKQVIKYTSIDELPGKLVERNTQLLRQLRKVSRDARLGINTAENIPESAQRFDNITEFKARDLNVDERFQLAQDLVDPEKFASARDRLLESAIGQTPEKLRETLNNQQIMTLQLLAKQNFDIFAADTPQFYSVDPENRKTLTDWMFKNKLSPTVENFQTAYQSLNSAGLLNEAPVVRPEPVTVVEPAPKAQEPVVPESRITPVEQPQPKRQSQIPSGLNDRVSSAAGASPVDANVLTLAKVDQMTPDEYKAAIKNPAFAKKVNELEQEALLKRRQRLGQV